MHIQNHIKRTISGTELHSLNSRKHQVKWNSILARFCEMVIFRTARSVLYTQTLITKDSLIRSYMVKAKSECFWSPFYDSSNSKSQRG